MSLKDFTKTVSNIVNDELKRKNEQIDKRKKIELLAAQNNIKLPQGYEVMKENDVVRHIANELERKQKISLYDQNGIEYNPNESSEDLSKNFVPRLNLKKQKSRYYAANLEPDKTWTTAEEYEKNFTPRFEFKKNSDEITAAGFANWIDETDNNDTLKKKLGIIQGKFNVSPEYSFKEENEKTFNLINRQLPGLLSKRFNKEQYKNYYANDAEGKELLDVSKISANDKAAFIRELYKTSAQLQKQEAGQMRDFLRQTFGDKISESEIEAYIKRDAKLKDIFELGQLYQKNYDNMMTQENKERALKLGNFVQFSQTIDKMIETSIDIPETERKKYFESIIKERNLPEETLETLLQRSNTIKQEKENKERDLLVENAFKAGELTAEEHTEYLNRPKSEILRKIKENANLRDIYENGYYSKNESGEDILVNASSSLKDINNEITKFYNGLSNIPNELSQKIKDYFNTNNADSNNLTYQQTLELKSIRNDFKNKEIDIQNKIKYLEHIHSNKIQTEQLNANQANIVRDDARAERSVKIQEEQLEANKINMAKDNERADKSLKIQEEQLNLLKEKHENTLTANDKLPAELKAAENRMKNALSAIDKYKTSTIPENIQKEYDEASSVYKSVYQKHFPVADNTQSKTQTPQTFETKEMKIKNNQDLDDKGYLNKVSTSKDVVTNLNNAYYELVNQIDRFNFEDYYSRQAIEVIEEMYPLAVRLNLKLSPALKDLYDNRNKIYKADENYTDTEMKEVIKGIITKNKKTSASNIDNKTYSAEIEKIIQDNMQYYKQQRNVIIQQLIKKGVIK